MRIHLWVSGTVQGVGYRATLQRAALQVGLNGWVRNLADGRVEAVLEGSPSVVSRIVDWCRYGVPIAVVDHLETKVETVEGLTGFLIKPTLR